MATEVDCTVPTANIGGSTAPSAQAPRIAAPAGKGGKKKTISAFPPLGEVDVETQFDLEERVPNTRKDKKTGAVIPLDGESAFVKFKGSRLRELGRDMRCPFAIAPSGKAKDVYSATDKLSMSVNYDPERHADSLAVAQDLDTKTKALAFARKEQFFGKKKASDMIERDIAKMYNPLVSSGEEREDGSTYDAKSNLKIIGWGEYIESTTMKPYKDKESGAEKQMIASATYRERPYEGKMDVEKGRTTVFKRYIDTEIDPETGEEIEIYTDKWAARDSKGKIRKGIDGLPLLRYVGPQDVTPNSLVTPAAEYQKVYFQDKGFGATWICRLVLFKPAAKSEEKTIKGTKDLSDKETQRLLALAEAEDVERPAGDDNATPSKGDTYGMPSLPADEEKQGGAGGPARPMPSKALFDAADETAAGDAAGAGGSGGAGVPASGSKRNRSSRDDDGEGRKESKESKKHKRSSE